MHGSADWGALVFGVVIGWITYRTLARSTGSVQVSDLATVLGAVGGAAVTARFDNEALFGRYSIGLAIGFFGYLITFFALNGKKQTGRVMGGDEPTHIG